MGSPFTSTGRAEVPSDRMKVTDTFVELIFDEEGTDHVRMRSQLFVLIASEVRLNEEGGKRDRLCVFAVQRRFDVNGCRYPGCDAMCVFVRWCSLFYWNLQLNARTWDNTNAP